MGWGREEHILHVPQEFCFREKIGFDVKDPLVAKNIYNV